MILKPSQTSVNCTFADSHPEEGVLPVILDQMHWNCVLQCDVLRLLGAEADEGQTAHRILYPARQGWANARSARCYHLSVPGRLATRNGHVHGMGSEKSA